MPTGYTAAVADGKVTELREFALQCARGMGALIMMRDEPMDAPIPERFEPTDYHAKKREAALARLTAAQAMTAEEASAAAAAALAAVTERNRRYAAEKEEQGRRYDAMFAKVEAWQGAPEGLKEFMLSQLNESVGFDCGGEIYQEPTTHLRDGEAWRAAEIERAARDVAYHSEEHAKEIARTEERNKWLSQLHSALLTREPK